MAQEEADGRLCGGFMFLRATSGTRHLWKQVTQKHEELVEQAKKAKSLDSIDESEQSILLELLPT